MNNIKIILYLKFSGVNLKFINKNFGRFGLHRTMKNKILRAYGKMRKNISYGVWQHNKYYLYIISIFRFFNNLIFRKYQYHTHRIEKKRILQCLQT